MKKNLFFVFTMLCALSFFTACSDDDDNKTDDGWKAISATYTAETLKLTMGGTEVADQSVKVPAIGAVIFKVASKVKTPASTVPFAETVRKSFVLLPSNA